MSIASISTATYKTFAPPRVSKLKQQLKDSPFPASIGRVRIVAWLSQIGMGWGRLQGLTQLKKEIDSTFHESRLHYNRVFILSVLPCNRGSNHSRVLPCKRAEPPGVHSAQD